MALDQFLTDMSPTQKNQKVPPFFRQLALSKRLVEGPLSVVLDNIVAPYDEASRGVQRLKAEREKAGAMTARQLAQQLNVERSTLKLIVDRDKIKISKKRGISRRHVWFTQEHLQQANEFLGKRVSARVWMRFSMSGLYIHRELADDFRLSILNETQPMFVAAGNRSVDWYPEMLRGEAECYLNVSCPEITWLARQGYFGDDAREGGPLRRSDVESLGQEFIGTREIATLAGCTTASVLGALRKFGVSPVIADVPFWRRRAVVGDGGAIHQIALARGRWGLWASSQR